MNNPGRSSDVRLSLKTQAGDNVATVLDDQLEFTKIDGGRVIEQGIPFGHKVALVCQRRPKVTSLAGEKVHQFRCARFVHGPARRSALI